MVIRFDAPVAALVKGEVSSRKLSVYLPTSVEARLKLATPAVKFSVARLLAPGCALGRLKTPIVGAVPPGSAPSRVNHAFKFFTPAYAVTMLQVAAETLSFAHSATLIAWLRPATCTGSSVKMNALSEKAIAVEVVLVAGVSESTVFTVSAASGLRLVSARVITPLSAALKV